MRITLDLDPEVEEKLREKAARQGHSIEEYLLDLAEKESAAAQELPARANLPKVDSPKADSSEKSSGEADQPRRKRSILELEGVGAELWRQELQGRDAQEYIKEMRREWDHRL